MAALQEEFSFWVFFREEFSNFILRTWYSLKDPYMVLEVREVCQHQVRLCEKFSCLFCIMNDVSLFERVGLYLFYLGLLLEVVDNGPQQRDQEDDLLPPRQLL